MPEGQLELQEQLERQRLEQLEHLGLQEHLEHLERQEQLALKDLQEVLRRNPGTLLRNLRTLRRTLGKS